MARRAFGWTGEQVPLIGLGTWNLEGSREAEQRAIQALRTGLDLGMTHIDTAEMYGNGRVEELVGEAIAGRRDEVFLASKVLPSNASYKGTLRACERSLQRLRTDRLDLYMLHWPGSHPLSETLRALAKLVEAGKIRYAGISNFDVDGVQAAQQALRRERLACNQVLYHLGGRGIERRLIPYCDSEQIAVVGYSPFGHRGFRGAALQRIARRHGKTPRQVALNFQSRRAFLIPKSGDPEHVRENAGGGGGWELAPEDIAEIERAFPAPARDVPLGMI